MLALFDTETRQPLGYYETTDEAIQTVGGVMSIYGPQYCQNKFLITELPNQRGRARIVMQAHDVYGQALPYYNDDYYKAHRGDARIMPLLQGG